LNVNWNVALAPLANEAMVQTIGPVPLQLNAGPVVWFAETKVMPAGTVSVSVTLAAFDGPAFAAVTVYVTFVCAGVAPGALFVTVRSALALTSVEAVDELLLGFESGVVDVTFAVFITVVPFVSEPLNVTVTLNVADAPAAKVAMEQVTVAPVVQVNVGPLVCDSETNVVPAGSVSVSVTEAASEGPRFWSAIV